MVLAFYEGVVMDSFPVVFRAEITFHETDFTALTVGRRERSYSPFMPLEILSIVSLSGICDVTAETFSFLIAS